MLVYQEPSITAGNPFYRLLVGENIMTEIITGNTGSVVGQTPGLVLINPKYAHNVGAVVRAASCYGVRQVWYTGERVRMEIQARKRLPREERMRGYQEVDLINADYPFDFFPKGAIPVAVEIQRNAEPLPLFDHPQNALYIFGPEDGSLPPSILRHCHRFVIIPSRHCLNLAASVYTVLYDRAYKRFLAGEQALPYLEGNPFACDMDRDSAD